MGMNPKQVPDFELVASTPAPPVPKFTPEEIRAREAAQQPVNKDVEDSTLADLFWIWILGH